MTLTLLTSQTPTTPGAATTFKAYTCSTPAAGSEWAEAVPAGEQWQPLALLAFLQTSAAVAARNPILSIAVGGLAIVKVPPAATLPDSSVGVFDFYRGALSLNSQNTMTGPMPDLVLPSGSTVGSQTGNIQAGDQWSSIVIYVLAYLR